MIISKSDYNKYLQCPRYFWLYKHRKDLLSGEVRPVGPEANGQVVELEAYKLFPDGVEVEGTNFRDGVELTTNLIMDKTPAIFQASFWENDLYCRSDIIKYNEEDNTWDLYEVKSSTKVKDEHLPDLAFQKVCLREAGLKVRRSMIIHVNSDYVRQGEIEAEKFLTVVDVTEEVDGLVEQVQYEIQPIRDLDKEKSEPYVKILRQCYAPYECPFIEHCWQEIPEHSIYNTSLKDEELSQLLDDGVVSLLDLPAGTVLKEKYQRYYEALKVGVPLVDKVAITSELAEYNYPIYFLDYETYSSALPLYDGYRPYQQMVFQYSLHILERPDGELKHFEYLAYREEDPVPGLIDALSKQIGDKGTVVAWYKSFEATRNTEMGEMHPKFRQFFDDVNGRLFDLMDFFAKGYYVDKNFFGSASLKKVLPVLVPNLSYDDLNIREGGTASASWPLLYSDELESGEKEDLKNDMLAYCERDTLAMVAIFRFLGGVVKG